MSIKRIEGGVPPVEPPEKIQDREPQQKEPPGREKQRADVGVERRFFRAPGAGYDAHGAPIEELMTQEEAEAAGYDWKAGRLVSTEQYKKK